MALKVSSVQVKNGKAVVFFADGHKAIFTENTGGWELSMALERIRLEYAGQTVACFHSQHQHPVNFIPFGIVNLAPGYDVARATSYWTAAYDHVSQAARSGYLINTWHVICLGHRDIEELRNGQWPAP